MSSKGNSEEEKIIQITEEDLIPLISIGEADLPEAIIIDEEDLPEIICINDTDLPEIVRISLKDLVPNQDLNQSSTDCFHGTSLQAAKQIQKEGFRVGPGNAFGSGIYFAVGAVSIAEAYKKSSTPCIIRARVNWGNVAYMDQPSVHNKLYGMRGDKLTNKALSMGYDSVIQCSEYSQENPTIGIVLGKRGSYIRPPKIQVLELLH